MAKSKYEFKKLKAKSLPAKIVDSTAVRVLAKAAKRLSSGWKQFTARTASMITNVQVPRVDEVTRLATKIEANQDLVDTIKRDEQATAADYKVMSKAQAENERLAAKLEKIMNKKVTVETKTGTSIDLNATLTQVADQPTSLDELNNAFDAAGIPNVTPEATIVNVETPVETPVEQTVVEQPVVPTISAVEAPAPTPATNNVDLNAADPVVSQVLAAINSAKNAAEQNRTLSIENQRLATDNKSKDEQISGLQQNVSSLGSQNEKLNAENETLKQTNSAQVTTIANLTRENDNLKNNLKDHNVVVQKVSEYENIIARHEKERTEMAQEFDRLKIGYSDSQNQLRKLEADMQKILKERDYYQSQITALKNAIGLVDTTPTMTNDDQSRVR